MNTMTTRALAAVAVLALAGPLLAADGPTGPRKERVTFAKGASSATIKANLKGGADLDYLVRAAAGQTLEVKLKATNGQNYFNVLPPRLGQRGDVHRQHVRGTVLVRRAAGRRRLCHPRLPYAPGGAPERVVAVHADGCGDRQAAAAPSAARDAKVAGTAYHATAKVQCTLPYQPDVKSCDAGVVRRGNDGTATFEAMVPWGCSGASCSFRASRSPRTRWIR